MSWYSIVRRGGTTSTPWDPSLSADVFAWYTTEGLTVSDTTSNANGDDAVILLSDEIASTQAAARSSNPDHAPILTASTQNGLAVLEQQSSNGLYGTLSTGNLGNAGTATEITFAAVSRNTSQGTVGVVDSGPFMMEMRDGSNRFITVAWSDSGAGQVATTSRCPYFRLDAGNTRYSSGPVVTGVDTWRIYTASFNLSTGQCELFVDGTSNSTATISGTSAIDMSTARVSVFGSTSYSFHRKALNGSQGGEFVFAESIDATLRQKAEGHLAHKWGLTANLAVGHPYKTTAPTA